MGALDKLTTVAANLLTTFGTNATLTSVTTGSYNTSTGTATPSESTSTVKVRMEPYRAYEIGGQVEAGDIRVLMAQEGNPTPAAGDLLTVGGDEYRVQEVWTTYATDNVALYELRVRR